MEKTIKKQSLLYGTAAILLALVLGTLIYEVGVFQPQPVVAATPVSAPRSSILSSFPSEDDLKDFLKTSSTTQGSFVLYGSTGIFPEVFAGTRFTDSTQINSAGAESSTFQHSTTNVQVSGVDEADIVKTDGKGYLYALSSNVIYILKAYPPTEAGIVSKIALKDFYPNGIFVNSDRLIVVGHLYGNAIVRENYYEQDTKTYVKVFDVQDRSSPQLLRDFSLTGCYFSSRMIGDYLYLVVNNEPAYVVNEKAHLPQITSNGKVIQIAPSEIRYCNGTDDYYQYTTFLAMNVQNITEAPIYLPILLGGASNMYVSLSNMYVTFRGWYWNTNTTIYRVRIQASNMTVEAKGTVPGHERNQFSMDEYNDYFRIETTTISADWTTRTNLYVLDMNLSIVGRLENLAPGEDFHSARFMGNRAYFVTFKKTDPLFVIDLTEPASPTVLGELKIPGYSDYLHPYDETHLIGVGKETVEAEEGDFAWYQGIKVSLFDVSNVTNPTQMATITIGHRGSDSPVLTDHKAFLFDRSKNLLSIPVLVAKIEDSEGAVQPYAYGTPVWQGACVYDVSLEHGFVLKGNITHLETGMNPYETGYWVKRSLYMENVFYTVSDRKVKLNLLEDLAPITEIPLA